ncbi:hypothetical protein QUB47_24580 [Microcoleus sp. AT9_B5]
MPNPTGHIDSIKETQFSSPWQSGPTRTIRVPIALADATLEYARQLDKGIELRNTVDNTDSRLEVNATLSHDTGGSNDEVERLKAELVELRSQIEVVQVENEQLKACQPAVEFNRLEVAEWHKRFHAKYPKSKATYSDFIAFLKMG